MSDELETFIEIIMKIQYRKEKEYLLRIEFLEKQLEEVSDELKKYRKSKGE